MPARPGAEGGVGNAVCRRCWDRVQIASRASENDDGYRGGIRCVWLDRVEEDEDSPDAGTGEGAAAGGDTNTSLPRLEIAAAGQKYNQVHQFIYLGGLITEDPDITRDINRRTNFAWGCFRTFSTKLFDRPSAPLRLKARLLKAEAMEALLYGCMTWAPCNAHYRQLRTTHHKLLLRVIGYRRVHGTYRKMSYAKALKKNESQSVEATIRQRRLLFAGALARQGDKQLPKRLLFAGRLEGGEDPGPGQPAQHWQKSLRDDFQAFGALHDSTPTDRRTFGVYRLVWTDAARKEEGVPWYTEILLGAERFMASWHKSQEEASRLREVNRASKALLVNYNLMPRFTSTWGFFAHERV